MNNKLKYLGLALTALLAACSADEELQEARGVENNTPAPEVIQAALQPSDQKISFTSITGAASVTRAGIDDITDIDNIGVFCLSKSILKDENSNNIATSQTPLAVSWDPSSAQYPLNAWLENEKAKIEAIPNSVGHELQFISGDKYYPSGNWYNYDFVAYYPYTEKIRRNTVSNGVIGAENYRCYWAEMELDGTQDIMVATSYEAEKDPTDPDYDLNYRYRWSAYYYKVEGTEKPSLNFQHLLSRLNFKVRAVNHAASIEFDNLGLSVDSIVVKNVRYHLCMRLADNTLSAYPQAPPVGAIQWMREGNDASKSTKVKDFYLRNTDGTSLSTGNYSIPYYDANPTEGNDLGGANMLVAPGNNNYRLEIYLGKTVGGVHTVYSVGGAFTLATPYKNPSNPSEGPGWVAGRAYTIDIVLNSPTQITTVATYDSWTSHSEKVDAEF